MEFKEQREKVDKAIQEIKRWIEDKNIYESSRNLQEVQELLRDLRKSVENDVQERAVSNLTMKLEILAEEIDEILSKREAGKKEDGNVAFKCNWNDKQYKAVCSTKAYEFNVNDGRAWCSISECNCREYLGKIVSFEDHPCYESIALRELYFGAGWDKTAERNQPRHIHSAREGRMAILTTRPPGTEEGGRLVIGCLFIKEVRDDPNTETEIFGDKDKSFEIDYTKVKIKFWDYYKNAGAEDLILWASGLFRYISDETVLNILKGTGEKYKNAGLDIRKIMNLIKYYEEIVQSKKKLTANKNGDASNF